MELSGMAGVMMLRNEIKFKVFEQQYLAGALPHPPTSWFP